MSSVTQRINEIKQPRGGYVKPSMFKAIPIISTTALNQIENITPNIIGMVIDHMTRFMLGIPPKKAFKISILGAIRAEKYGVKNSFAKATQLLKGIEGINRQSIINACKLVTFDTWFRNPSFAQCSKINFEDINPDSATIENIQIMIERSLAFFDMYGEMVCEGFTFEPDGYTSTVDSGDGDFLTEDTLWEFKVIKSKPNNKHTLQLLMYWIMGQHSNQEIYKNINKLGIFNARHNIVYILNIEDIPKSVIEIVEKEVIGY